MFKRTGSELEELDRPTGPNDDYRSEMQREFENAVKPIHEWLCKYGHPHMHVIVHQDGAEASEGIIAVPMRVPD